MNNLNATFKLRIDIDTKSNFAQISNIYFFHIAWYIDEE